MIKCVFESRGLRVQDMEKEGSLRGKWYVSLFSPHKAKMKVVEKQLGSCANVQQTFSKWCFNKQKLKSLACQKGEPENHQPFGDELQKGYTLRVRINGE